MATNPKPIRRHLRAALHRYRRLTGGANRRVKNARRKLSQLPPRLGHFVLIGRNPVRVSLFHWAIWFEYAKNRIIKQTILPGGVRVSTVFLGLDHSFSLDSPPLLFETMIFGGEYNNFQERYTTYEEALQGHAQAIELSFQVK